MHMVLMDLQEREPSPGAYTERMEPRAELLGTGADERVLTGLAQVEAGKGTKRVVLVAGEFDRNDRPGLVRNIGKLLGQLVPRGKPVGLDHGSQAQTAAGEVAIVELPGEGLRVHQSKRQPDQPLPGVFEAAVHRKRHGVQCPPGALVAASGTRRADRDLEKWGQLST